MIPHRDLEVLESFNGNGRILLSAYFNLNTPQGRQAALAEFKAQAHKRLEECGRSEECHEAIREDIEIVDLYLRSNGQRWHPGLAIFSCAAELFWRAYPLPVAVPTRVSVDSHFDLEPLREVIERRPTP